MTEFNFDQDTRQIETVPTAHTMLADTMAGLLFTAVIDARSLDRSKYTPSSNDWHCSGKDDFCLVCLTGSVMAGTLEFPSDLDIAPFMFSEPSMDKLQAINYMRIGEWNCAFTRVHGYPPPPSIRRRLNELGIPRCPNFYGWKQLDAHLQSLEELIPLLREIEQQALSLRDQS